MIQNRAFQGSIQGGSGSTIRSLQFWHTRGDDVLTLDNEAPLLSNALPWHMRVDVGSGATGLVGFWNEGWAGYNITTTTRYAASFHMRGTYSGTITAAFWSNTTGNMLGSTTYTANQQE